MQVLPANPENILQAAQVLKNGGLVAFPTDTVYGIGAHAFRADAVERLYVVKGRPAEKAIPLLLARADDVSLVARQIPDAAHLLIERFWPGGLTLVLFKQPTVSAAVSGGPGVAVRVPDHAVTRALIEALGAPLAATSANLSGQPELLDAPAVQERLGDSLDLILDGGRAPGGVPSTVVDLTTHPPRLLRRGAIPVETLAALLPDL